MDVRMPVMDAARTVDDVFIDFAGRRLALVKALTTDSDKLYQQCNPERENLCLYGLPNETWDVNLPVDEVPPELPEPALGINFARDGTSKKEWLLLVAAHSDSWLLAVAFYFAARFGFNMTQRKKLFDMINELPTLLEVLNDKVVKPRRDQQSAPTRNNIVQNRPIEKSRQSESISVAKGVKMPARPSRPVNDDEEDDESGEENEDDDDDQGAFCGACGNNDGPDDFWICCDLCEVWFHGKCVNITPAKAERIVQYKCPICSSNKKARV